MKIAVYLLIDYSHYQKRCFLVKLKYTPAHCNCWLIFEFKFAECGEKDKISNVLILFFLTNDIETLQNNRTD